MRILEKHVLKSYAGAFVFCLLLLIVLGIIGDVLGFIDDIFKHNIPLGSILAFYANFAPFAFVNMVPFACILSSAYVFNTLSKNHEVTAVIASGLSLWKLLRPVILFTFVICLGTFIVNEKLVPTSTKKANRIKQEELETVDKDHKGDMRNLAVYGRGNRLIFAKTYDPVQKVLENVIIHKQNNEHEIQEKQSIRRLEWNGGKWIGIDVVDFKLTPNGEFSQDPEVFKKKEIQIREKPSEFRDNQWDPRFMSFGQLSRYLKIFRIGSTVTRRRLLVDLNYKLAFPFASVVVVMICVPFSIETGRANALIGMVRGISISMLYIPVMAISLALGKGGVMPPALSAWLSNIVFTLAGVYYIHKKS